MRHAPKARFDRWAPDHKAGALAALMKAAMEIEEHEEVARLWGEAQQHDVVDLVASLVEGTRLPMRSAAERNYNVLDHLHKRVQVILLETIRLKMLARTPTERELLQGQERELEEESNALALVLNEVKQAHLKEVRELVEEGEQLRQKKEAAQTLAVEGA